MDRFVGYLSKGFMCIGGVALLVLVVLATANVVFRLLHIPFAGTYEVVSFLGALVTAAALAHTQRRRDHIMVDILTDRFPPGVKRWLDALSDAITAVLFGVIAWQIWAWGNNLKLSGERSETLQLVYYPFVYGVAAGFALLSLVLLIQLAQALLHREEGTAV